MWRSAPFVSYFRNFVFGVEDSLVSTVGLLSGIAVADVPRETIFLTGVVLIFAEAFSMAAGSFLSETSADNLRSGDDHTRRRNIVSGIIMFFSYFISGFIPLSPYIFWQTSVALPISIIFSLIALLILGLISARVSKVGFIKSSLRMVIVGGIAIAIGSLAGMVLSR